MGLKNAVSNILSAPSRAISHSRGADADRKRGALKLAQQTKGVPADPATRFGRSIIGARNVQSDLRKKYMSSSDGKVKR